MRDDNASHWLTLSLYTGLLLAFLLAACVSAAWPHLHPSSVEILAPTATTVQLELVFAAADAATLVALAPAGLRRDAAERLRDALRAVPGAIRWRVRVSARQAVLPSAGEEEALLPRPARDSALRFYVLLQRAAPLAVQVLLLPRANELNHRASELRVRATGQLLPAADELEPVDRNGEHDARPLVQALAANEVDGEGYATVPHADERCVRLLLFPALFPSWRCSLHLGAAGRAAGLIP